MSNSDFKQLFLTFIKYTSCKPVNVKFNSKNWFSLIYKEDDNLKQFCGALGSDVQWEDRKVFFEAFGDQGDQMAKINGVIPEVWIGAHRESECVLIEKDEVFEGIETPKYVFLKTKIRPMSYFFIEPDFLKRYTTISQHDLGTEYRGLVAGTNLGLI